MSPEVVQQAKRKHDWRMFERGLLWAAMIAGIVKLWVMPLGTSLWVDEAGTFWTINGSFREMIAHCFVWPSQSLLYSTIAWTALHVGGMHEIVLRLPSTVAALAAVPVLYRLGVRIFNPTAAQLATIVFICTEPVAFAAADARPYALGLLAVLVATLMLVRWLDTGRLWYGAVYVVAAAAAIHLQYIFGLSLLAQGVYGLYRIRAGSKLSWVKLAASGLGVALLSLPLLPHFLLVAKHTRSWAATPTPHLLAAALIPTELFAGIFGGLLVAAAVCRRLRLRIPPISGETLLLLLTWYFIPLAVLTAISIFTPSKIFLPRYYLFALPAFALLIGWALSAIEPERARLILGVSIIAAAVSTFGGLWRVRSHGEENWRAAMATVRSVVGTSSTPVIVRSGLVESSFVGWPDEARRVPYLFAPLLVYPPAGRVVPVPYSLNDETKAYLDEVADSLKDEEKVLLVTSEPQGWLDHWLEGRLSPAGFDLSRAWMYKGYVHVLLFEKSSNEPHP